MESFYRRLSPALAVSLRLTNGGDLLGQRRRECVHRRERKRGRGREEERGCMSHLPCRFRCLLLLSSIGVFALPSLPFPFLPFPLLCFACLRLLGCCSCESIPPFLEERDLFLFLPSFTLSPSSSLSPPSLLQQLRGRVGETITCCSRCLTGCLRVHVIVCEREAFLPAKEGFLLESKGER